MKKKKKRDYYYYYLLLLLLLYGCDWTIQYIAFAVGNLNFEAQRCDGLTMKII